MLVPERIAAWRPNGHYIRDRAAIPCQSGFEPPYASARERARSGAMPVADHAERG
jgi:hypothetical protein